MAEKAKGSSTPGEGGDSPKLEPDGLAASTPPPAKHHAPGKCSGIATFCCNKEEGTCLGRTPLSWLKITIYYFLFYLALFLFFVFAIFVALYSFKGGKPQATLSDSLIGQPGLGYRPTNTNKDSALIWYNKEDEESYSHYVKQLEEITNAERNATKNPKNMSYIHCDKLDKDMDEAVSDNTKQRCAVYYDPDIPSNHDKWGTCIKTHQFGFPGGAPCILVRLNRIIDWLPEKLAEPDEHVPMDISQLGITKDDHVVCIHCEGENQFDKELLGRINYYPGGHRPGPCLPKYFFPFRNQTDYLSPFIFVQFPQLPLGVQIQVRCTAYNSKIKPDHNRGLGMVRFELLVDNNATIKAPPK